MNWVVFHTIGIAALASVAMAEGAGDVRLTDDVRAADVIFLGEQHDNPGHHVVQAKWVQALQPTAIVFEMLTPEMASLATPEVRGDAATLEQQLGWEAAGWPDFGMYFPIFAAAPTAGIWGAGVERESARGVMTGGLVGVAGDDVAERFTLSHPLPQDQQTARETLQREAHCDALPEGLIPAMVDIQRLRDASLAQAALEALATTGGPVVVITGNGHARMDWGAPAMLRAAVPNIKVFSLGQGEAGQGPSGGFDTVVDSPAVDRGDPCDAFR